MSQSKASTASRPREATQLPRTSQACIQCRTRKLKCVMEPVDGVCGPPCKRCRRESKDCTVPPAKRKRYTIDDTPAPMPSKRQHVQQSIEPTERLASKSPVEKVEVGMESATQPLRNRFSPSSDALDRTRKQTVPSRSSNVRKVEASEDNDAYIINTAAPWAFDFLPVTFCGTIADLSQAYGYQVLSEPSEETISAPSTASDGEGTSADEDRRFSDADSNGISNTISHANARQKDPTISTAPDTKKHTPILEDGAFSKDLGLDDFFDYVHFG